MRGCQLRRIGHFCGETELAFRDDEIIGDPNGVKKVTNLRDEGVFIGSQHCIVRDVLDGQVTNGFAKVLLPELIMEHIVFLAETIFRVALVTAHTSSKTIGNKQTFFKTFSLANITMLSA